MNESFKYRSDRSQTGADRDTPLNLTGQRLIARGNRNGNYNNSNVDETKIGRNYPQAQRHTHTHTHTHIHIQPLGIDRYGSPQQLEHTPSAMCHATAVGGFA